MHRFIVSDPIHFCSQTVWMDFIYKKGGSTENALAWLGDLIDAKCAYAQFSEEKDSFRQHGRLIGENIRPDSDRFSTETGVVCVASFDSNTLYRRQTMDELLRQGKCAVFYSEHPIEELRIEFDKENPEWTVLRVFDPKGKLLVQSLENPER